MISLINFGEHCHPPNEIEVKMKKIRKKIKDCASVTREKPMQIISSAVERLDDEAKGFIGNVDSIC